MTTMGLAGSLWIHGGHVRLGVAATRSDRHGISARRAAAVFALLVAYGGPVAAETTPADQALAQTLFDRGRELMAAKKYGEACEKFAESERLDPSVGTELNLGLCYESQGRTAAAWAAYRAASARARRDGRRDREQAARDRAAALEPKLSRVSMALAPGADLPGLEVRLDGTVLGRATLDVAAPIDPGSHVVEVRAPGYRTWTSKFDVDSPTTRPITIPPLSADPARNARPPSPSTATPALSTAMAAQATPSHPAASPEAAAAPNAANAPTSAPAVAMPPNVSATTPAPSPATLPNQGSPSARTWVGGRYWLDAATVEDVKTALTWQRYVIPRGAVWEAAAAYCSALRVGGAGWRLPTPIELASLAVPGRMPAVDPQAFPQTPAGWFWTADHHPWGVAEAISSTTGAKQPVMSDRPLYVRCVR
jgi:hypothetical protein